MKKFLSEDFLLTTDTAQKLYFDYAEKMPIIDYHCHVSPKEIYEDKHFENITELWLGGDHYKWRLMRSNGIEEHYITGNANPRDKFRKFAQTLPRAIGNPMYHWCHLELKNYFGYSGILNAGTADEVYNHCQKKLHDGNMSVRSLITQSNVEFIGTTDDPCDSLEYHKLIANDPSFKTTVAPSFRPDKILNIEKDGWADYIARLSTVSDIDIDSVTSLKIAIISRIDYFDACGCRASDHGLDYAVFSVADADEVEKIFNRGMSGFCVNTTDAESFKTHLLLFCAAEYAKRDWVMQIHYNCMRNPNSNAFVTLGADTGFDCIGPHDSTALSKLLNTLYCTKTLPKTVLYSLDQSDNQFLDCLIGAFQGEGFRGKLQHGSAWWFNDHKQGMRDQLVSLANLGLLGNFIGMLTDSRSFLSYARHEYFRRILCGLIGEWVENGEYPYDESALADIIRGICYENAKEYFRL